MKTPTKKINAETQIDLVISFSINVLANKLNLMTSNLKKEIIWKKESFTGSLMIALTIFLVSVSGICLSQPNSAQKTPVNDASCLLKSFTIKQIDQKNYLNWRVLSDLTNFYFMLEKSSDGENFETVSMQKGGISPANQLLHFSFIDAAENSAKTVYRLAAYELHFSGKDIQVINLKEKNILEEAQNAIVEVINDFIAVMPPRDFSSK